MEKIEAFGKSYAKKFEKFKLFIQNKAKSESAKEKLAKIENGILKRNIESLPDIERKEKRNSRLSNGFAGGCLAIASFFAVMCMFGDKISEKVFTAVSVPALAVGGVLATTGLVYHIKLLANPSLKQAKNEIEKLQTEFSEFGDSEEYLKAFMSVNNLDEQKLNNEKQGQLLRSPLSSWGKLIEIYPELESE